jgi:hypothetical protein
VNAIQNHFSNYVFHLYFFCTFCCFFCCFDAGAGAGYLQKVHGEGVEVVEDVGEGEGGEFVIVEEGEGFEDE